MVTRGEQKLPWLLDLSEISTIISKCENYSQICYNYYTVGITGIGTGETLEDNISLTMNAIK